MATIRSRRERGKIPGENDRRAQSPFPRKEPVIERGAEVSRGATVLGKEAVK